MQLSIRALFANPVKYSLWTYLFYCCIILCSVLEVKILGQSNLTVSEGDPVSFTCLVQCVAPSIACVSVSGNWTRHGGDDDTQQLPDGAKISRRHTNTTLSFPSANVGDMGTYICRGVVQSFSGSDVAHLTVNGNNCISIMTMIFINIIMDKLYFTIFICICWQLFPSPWLHQKEFQLYQTNQLHFSVHPAHLRPYVSFTRRVI